MADMWYICRKKKKNSLNKKCISTLGKLYLE